MRLTFLGSGGAFCDYRVNYHNNGVVHTSEGPVLIDCGSTAAQSLKELGIGAHEVRAVLFTHLHGDHASPEMLIWERYYGGRFLRTELVGPADLLDPLQRALHPYIDVYSDHRGEVHNGGVGALVDCRTTTSIDIGGVRFRWFRVPHVVGDNADKPAYGIDIDDGRCRALWSGDTTFSERWVRDAAGDDRVARIFHECLFMPHFGGTVHTHFGELCTLPDAVQGQVTLMHHTAVPDGVELGPLAGAAARHETFDLVG